MSLMHAGKVLASGTPQELVQQGRGQSVSGVYLPGYRKLRERA